jgi:4'-phosphopantetheinyl transferase
MMAGLASVLRWPASFDAAQERLIVAVDAPDTPIRETARQQVRDVLREILGDVELISRPGQPIRVAGQVKTPGISVSHEAGLSLVAVHLGVRWASIC